MNQNISLTVESYFETRNIDLESFYSSQLYLGSCSYMILTGVGPLREARVFDNRVRNNLAWLYRPLFPCFAQIKTDMCMCTYINNDLCSDPAFSHSNKNFSIEGCKTHS